MAFREANRRNFSDCDYVKTRDGIVFIVRGYYHEKGVLAVPVFFPKEDGERADKSGRRYTRALEEQNGALIASLHPEYLAGTDYGALLRREDIEVHYEPRDALKEFLASGALEGTAWGRLITALKETAGIPAQDIGVYGSSLPGLSTNGSDIDIIVYGVDNLLKLRENFEEILKYPGICRATEEDIQASASKSQKTHTFDRALIEKMKRNRWSALNVDGKNMTIRFGYREDEIPPNPITSPPMCGIAFSGYVVDALHSNFMPRVFTVKDSLGKRFDVVSYYWLFFSCVNDGDRVEVVGTFREDGHRSYVTLDRPHHYIAPRA